MPLETEIESAQRLVRTDAYQLSIGEVVNMYRERELLINPDFQRLFRWDIGQKSKLIESLFLGIPLPPIFVFEQDDGKWELIDGLQRVSTLLEFMGQLRDPANDRPLPPTALVATHYLPSLDRVVWERSDLVPDVPPPEQMPLSGPMQLAIRRARLSVEILKRPSSNSTKYDLFQRLNAGGTALNPQEMRNVIIIMVNGEYHAFMKRLAQRPSYLTVLAASTDQLEKQRDMEFVSRFLVLTFVDYDGRLDVEEFLDDGIVQLAVRGEMRSAEDTFNRTFDLLDQAFGANALRRFDNRAPVGRVLLAAYECIAVGIARNIDAIGRQPDPVEYIQRRIFQFWDHPEIISFFVAGLRGTVRIQRTVPFGARWFAP
jgi:hypothetical protein